jgi:multisubunit Na+/H+ antiporter MnhB subunit
MAVRVIISLVVASVVGVLFMVAMSTYNYLKALFEVADGGWCFYVSPTSVSSAVAAGLLAFFLSMSILSRR